MNDRPGDRWSPPRFSRREALGLGAAAVASTIVSPAPVSALTSPTRVGRPGRRASVADSIKPDIRPRSDWAGDLGVAGELVPEDDVRFLLVHHTASTNDYGPDEVAEQIRRFYEFHTGPEKGWPDVAYNFFVDRYGGLWEARSGSLAGPVRGDATGGSQGFALLCSSIGDHAAEPMTAAATESLARLLAWLGESYAIDTNPGSTVSFTSRGSSRWAAGDEVTANTISGHRDMSTTSCPGDFLYGQLAETIPAAATLIRTNAGGGVATQPPKSPTQPSTSATVTGATAAETTATTAAADRASDADQPAGRDQASGAPTPDGSADDRSPALIVAGLLAGAVAAGGAVANRFWRRADPT